MRRTKASSSQENDRIAREEKKISDAIKKNGASMEGLEKILDMLSLYSTEDQKKITEYAKGLHQKSYKRYCEENGISTAYDDAKNFCSSKTLIDQSRAEKVSNNRREDKEHEDCSIS